MEENLINIIIANHIQLTPLVNQAGIVHAWIAGKKIPDPRGDKGYVPNHLFAKGETPREAVERLLNGRTVFRISDCGSGLIEQ